MADKIDIVVGASDRASSILRSINDQTAMLADTLDRTDQSAKSVTISMGGVTAAAGALAAAYAGLQVAESVASFLSKSSAEFVEIEKASRKLDPALRSLAKSIEIGTNTDEKSILGVMKQAQRQGFATDQIDDAAQAALGLSEAMGISLADGLTKARQAAEGNFDAFAYLIPGINELASADEKLAAVSRLASQGLRDKATIAGDATSVFDRMEIQLGNLHDTVGGMIEPFRRLAFEGIAKVAELTSNALTPAIADFESQFSGMGDTVGERSVQITESIVQTFTAIEIAVGNVTASMQLVGASLLLPLEQARSGWAYLFVDFIPALLNWFVENFTNMMRDLGVYATGVFKNIGDVAWDTSNYILTAFSPGAYAELMVELGRAGSQGFLEGVEPMTNAFIAPPVRISEFEKSLTSMADSAAETLLRSYQETVSGRLDAIQKGFKEKPFIADIDLKAKDSPMANMSSEIKILQATESRLLTRGATDDPLLKVSEKQLQVLQDLLNASIRRDENKDPQIILEGVN